VPDPHPQTGVGTTQLTNAATNWPPAPAGFTYGTTYVTNAYWSQVQYAGQITMPVTFAATVGTLNYGHQIVQPPATRVGYTPPGTEEARRKARELLLEHLSDEQRDAFERDGHFDVHVHTADGVHRYRVKHYYGVSRVDESGRVLRRYCIHPPSDYPEEDCALSQKILLETDEAEFLRVANEEVVAA
jgi:hypothetical protein